ALTVHEAVARDGRDRTQVVRVHEIEVSVVEYVHIANERVVDINVVEEARAAVEPGEERLAPAQREPTHAKAKSPAAAEEADERRSIARGTKERSWAPTPGAADERPAAVMEGSKTPRLIVYPGPTPRADPVPVTHEIGRASCRERVKFTGVGI